VCLHGAFSLWCKNSKAFRECPFALQHQLPEKDKQIVDIAPTPGRICGRPWLLSTLSASFQALIYEQVRLS